MDVTVSRLADAERGAIGSGLPDGFHFHVESRLLGTGDVEGRVTVGFVALDAGARAALLADVARELPASGRDVLDAIDGLQKHGVSKADLGQQKTTRVITTCTRVRAVRHGDKNIWTKPDWSL